jgi:hypothetical protein
MDERPMGRAERDLGRDQAWGEEKPMPREHMDELREAHEMGEVVTRMSNAEARLFIANLDTVVMHVKDMDVSDFIEWLDYVQAISPLTEPALWMQNAARLRAWEIQARGLLRFQQAVGKSRGK